MGFQHAHPLTPPAVSPQRGLPSAALIQPKLAMPAVPPVFAAPRRESVTVPLPFVLAMRRAPSGAGASTLQPVQRKSVFPPRPPTALPLAQQPRMPLASVPGKVAQLRTAPTAFASRFVQRASNTHFPVGGMSFEKPVNHEFSLAAAQVAVQPIPRGEAKRELGRGASTGVKVGDVGSYGYVQYAEKTGDGLTGDHQPSGAAVKEAVRELLHSALLQPLTRSMARNAYQKAITLVMTDVWHKKFSRTYGGRNSKAQILKDASDLATAAMEDWKTTVAGLRDSGMADAAIEAVWDELNAARVAFFDKGEAQAGTL